MSTAGKVLAVLILLSSIVWIILTAGVTQYDRNGNQAMIVLAEMGFQAGGRRADTAGKRWPASRIRPP